MDSVEILKALADDIRLDIVRHLAVRRHVAPSTELVGSCAHAMKLSQPTMSHHINKLVQAGVVSEQKEGKCKYYQLNVRRLRAIGIDPKKL